MGGAARRREGSRRLGIDACGACAAGSARGPRSRAQSPGPCLPRHAACWPRSGSPTCYARCGSVRWPLLLLRSVNLRSPPATCTAKQNKVATELAPVCVGAFLLHQGFACFTCDSAPCLPVCAPRQRLRSPASLLLPPRCSPSTGTRGAAASPAAHRALLPGTWCCHTPDGFLARCCRCGLPSGRWGGPCHHLVSKIPVHIFGSQLPKPHRKTIGER